MPTPPRSAYPHFCMLAKALERLGDRWALLVVRDLLPGPKRFTDLMDRLGGVTPRTLTQRLRDLESDGLVLADRHPGRREVWYRLTPAGQDLAPAVRELTLWGLRHFAAPPAPGEATHPEHLLGALCLLLNGQKADAGIVDWVIRTDDHGDSYTISGRAGQWTVQPGATAHPDVEVLATRRDLASYLTAPHPARTTRHPDVRLHGSEQDITRFLAAVSAFPPQPHAEAEAESP
jgi:DNA-binding HxlR family transcriptional regulator